jgi:hypothetical protein
VKALGEGLLGVLVVGSALFFVVWGFGALVTAEDVNYWERVNDNCYVHVTKVNDAMWTRGHDGPEIRTTYCKEALEGAS